MREHGLVEIAKSLARSVGIEMVRTEAERGSASNSGEVVDLVMRARAQSNDIKRRENAARAVELFRQALDLDPDNVDALAGIAALCSYQVVNLYRLAERDARKSEIVELLCFGGLTYEETAAALKISPATVHRELKMAKAFLHRELIQGSS